MDKLELLNDEEIDLVLRFMISLLTEDPQSDS